MTKPITPDEAAEQKLTNIPDSVIECWNRVISKHYVNGWSAFKQEEVVQAIIDMTGVERHEIFENRWLDVEPIYEAVGWIVEYDKPGYNETYAANFTFKRKQR